MLDVRCQMLSDVRCKKEDVRCYFLLNHGSGCAYNQWPRSSMLCIFILYLLQIQPLSYFIRFHKAK